MKFFQTKRTGFIAFIAAVIAFVFFGRIFGFLEPVRSVLLTTFRPVYDVFYRTGAGFAGVFSHSADAKTLETQINSLTEENLQLKVSIAKLQDVEKENESLRHLLDYFETQGPDFPRVIARVIGRDPESPSLLLLNIGRRDGVEENNAVVVDQGILIAKITEVYAQTSRALILTDPESAAAVTISGGAPTSKLARGERGLSVILDQIPQQETITVGQMVITSGLEPTVPRGLLVGEIEEIVSESNDLFHRAVLRPLVDYSGAHIVAVILTGKPSL